MSNYGQNLPRRRLGRSELMVPALGLGGAGLGGVYGDVSEDEAIELVRWSVEQGIDFLDTDASYGNGESERRIGLALQGLRDKVTLSTKVGTHPERRGDFSRDGVLWNVEQSLKTLQTDHVELLLIHDPKDMEPVMQKDGGLQALEELKAQGITKAIGFGLRRHNFHRIGLESGRIDVLLSFNDFNPIRTTSRGLFEEAKSHDVGVINGSPLAMGLLTGEDPDTIPDDEHIEDHEREMQAARRFYAWCRDKNVSLRALTFQFSLREPLVSTTITGAKTREEFEQDLQAATEPLPDGIWEELEKLDLPAGQTQPNESRF